MVFGEWFDSSLEVRRGKEGGSDWIGFLEGYEWVCWVGPGLDLRLVGPCCTWGPHTAWLRGSQILLVSGINFWLNDIFILYSEAYI